MKHKYIALICLSIFLISVITGCGVKELEVNNKQSALEQNSTASPAASSTASNTEAPQKSPLPAEKENVGIITDTVVDVFRNADTQSERVTQTIYNQPVEILDRKDNWMKVKVVDGYTGWIKSKFIGENTTSINAKDAKYKLVVTAKTSKVTTKETGGIELKQVVMCTEFYSANKSNNSYEVVMPDGKKGWINQSGVMQLEVNARIPLTGAENFITTLNKFKDTVYLWGGVSAWGIDCSGLTYICSRINGVELPRDADQQYKLGKAVPKDVNVMKPGDLVFFSSETDLKGISHIGVYIGNSEFIHAYKLKGKVTTSSLEQEYFKSRFVGVRRIFES